MGGRAIGAQCKGEGIMGDASEQLAVQDTKKCIKGGGVKQYWDKQFNCKLYEDNEDREWERQVLACGQGR